jgi:hypothetical protein
MSLSFSTLVVIKCKDAKCHFFSNQAAAAKSGFSIAKNAFSKI